MYKAKSQAMLFEKSITTKGKLIYLKIDKKLKSLHLNIPVLQILVN